MNMKTPQLLACTLAFTSANGQQFPLPKTAADVPGPVAGSIMTKEYVQSVGRTAYLFAWRWSTRLTATPPCLRPLYDWHSSQWTVPINGGISQLIKLGDQPVSRGLMGTWFAEAPSGAPEWGIRFVVTFLFPKS